MRANPECARACARGLRALLTLCLIGLWLIAAPAQAGVRATDLVKEGVKLLNRGDYADALVRLQAAYEDDPTLTRTLLLSGVCQQNLGDLGAALTLYERFQRAEPRITADDQAHLREYYREVQRQLRRRPERGETLVLLGRAQVGLGQPREALRLYDRYRAEVRGAGQADPLATVELRGLYEVAVDRLQEVSLGDPALARGLLVLGRTDDGYAAYERFQRGLNERPAAERDGALQAAVAELSREPQSPPALRLLASHALLRAGREREALEAYDVYRRETRGPAPAAAQPLLAELKARQRALAPEAPQLPLIGGPVAAPTPPARRPLYRRWWFWTAVGAATVVAVSVGAGAGAAQIEPLPAPMSSRVYRPNF